MDETKIALRGQQNLDITGASNLIKGLPGRNRTYI